MHVRETHFHISCAGEQIADRGIFDGKQIIMSSKFLIIYLWIFAIVPLKKKETNRVSPSYTSKQNRKFLNSICQRSHHEIRHRFHVEVESTNKSLQLIFFVAFDLICKTQDKNIQGFETCLQTTSYYVWKGRSVSCWPFDYFLVSIHKDYVDIFVFGSLQPTDG